MKYSTLLNSVAFFCVAQGYLIPDYDTSCTEAIAKRDLGKFMDKMKGGDEDNSDEVCVTLTSTVTSTVTAKPSAGKRDINKFLNKFKPTTIVTVTTDCDSETSSSVATSNVDSKTSSPVTTADCDSKTSSSVVPSSSDCGDKKKRNLWGFLGGDGTSSSGPTTTYTKTKVVTTTAWTTIQPSSTSDCDDKSFAQPSATDDCDDKEKKKRNLGKFFPTATITTTVKSTPTTAPVNDCDDKEKRHLLKLIGGGDDVVDEDEDACVSKRDLLKLIGGGDDEESDDDCVSKVKRNVGKFLPTVTVTTTVGPKPTDDC